MSYVKTIVCLANSRKTSGRCIAGLEIIESDFGPWVRPISKRSTKEISEVERRYENGDKAQVLDIVKIPLLKSAPVHHHVEDHLIDDEYYWEKVGMADWAMVESLVEPLSGPLWINETSTYHGINDKISEENAKQLRSSLILLRHYNFEIHVTFESAYMGGGKRCVRANFSLAGAPYLLKVTDPIVEQKYLGRDNGIYPINDAIMCVSLSEAWEGHVYKLVAAILTPDMAV